jgi:hypothetical protein
MDEWWTKSQWIRLHEVMEAYRNGTIRDIDFQDGIPVKTGEISGHRRTIDLNKNIIGQ